MVRRSYKAVDVPAMTLQERSEADFLFITLAILVSELGRNVSGGEPIKQDRDIVNQFGCIPSDAGCKRLAQKHDDEHKSEIHLYHHRSPQVSKQQGMQLQELDDRVQLVGEKYGKDEDRNDAPGAVDNPTRHRHEQNCQQHFPGSTI